jgi:hypothetical protein
VAGVFLLGPRHGKEVHRRPCALRVFVDFQYELLVFEVFAVLGRIIACGGAQRVVIVVICQRVWVHDELGAEVGVLPALVLQVLRPLFALGRKVTCEMEGVRCEV